jgi:hypothetical protein
MTLHGLIETTHPLGAVTCPNKHLPFYFLFLFFHGKTKYQEPSLGKVCMRSNKTASTKHRDPQSK